MEHHDLQKCTQQNHSGPGCKEEKPAPQWLLTTIWHKQQNRGRCELKEENLAPLRLQLGFSRYFYCLVRLNYEFTPGKVKPRLYTDVYDAPTVHYGGGSVNLVSP